MALIIDVLLLLLVPVVLTIIHHLWTEDDGILGRETPRGVHRVVPEVPDVDVIGRHAEKELRGVGVTSRPKERRGRRSACIGGPSDALYIGGPSDTLYIGGPSDTLYRGTKCHFVQGAKGHFV